MLNYTNNINTYKGLIYSLGIIIASIGYTFKNKQGFISIFENIKKVILYNVRRENNETYGSLCYKLYGIGGAQEEAINGFPTIIKTFNKFKDISFINNDLLKVLIYLIIETDDTCLLKRCKSIDKYLYFKELIINLDVNNTILLNKLNDKFIENNLSCGGSADLLVCIIFLFLVKSNGLLLNN